MSFNPVEMQQILALAHEDFACYCVALWPQFELARHHSLVVSELEAIERGQQSRLIVCLPPRHGKSLITSTLFPAWYLGRHPDRQVIFATYGQELSDDFGRRVRNIVADPFHQTIFPNCRLSDDSAAAHRFNTTRGGAYFAVGRGGPITGRGAHLLIIDDPLKDSEEASSDTVRNSLHEWFASVAYTRLMPDGAIVLIQTRWHSDDLAGRLLNAKDCERWMLLSLPAIAECDESFRHSGDALWPSRFPNQDLERIRTAIGGRAWVSLYQQRPSAAEGAIFKRDYWHFYKSPLNAKFSLVVQSWDTAFKTGTQNDYSVCTTWGANDSGYYLLHLWRGRVEFPELKRLLSSLAAQWKPHAILIEDKASGQTLVQELRNSTVLPVIPIKIDSDKIARAQAVTALIEAGKVYLPDSAPWLADFINEMASFPSGVNDDSIDSTTQALSYMREQADNVAKLRVFSKPSAPRPRRLDKEALWQKAMMGFPMSEEEIDQM